MKRHTSLRLEFSEPRSRAAFCLVLVALLLYNPFFTVVGSSRDTSVQHPISYRATLAGTELGRGILDAATPLVPQLAVAVRQAAILFLPSAKIASARPSDAAQPILEAVRHAIWFRPPPSA
jgi:hypothetical protein